MSFRKQLGLDPTTTKELGSLLAGKDELNSNLFLNMRSDIRTQEHANALTFFTMVGHEDIMNSGVARIVRNHLLTMGIGFKGKRAELVAQVLAQGNIQNERQTTSFDFSRVREEKD